MNTGQKYGTPASGATAPHSIEPAVNTPGQTPPTDDPQPAGEAIPFEPAFINFPVYLHVDGRDDADNYGASQLSMLMEALRGYRETISGHFKCDDTTLALQLIDELEESLLDAMFNRLSESSTILHKQRYGLPSVSPTSQP